MSRPLTVTQMRTRCIRCGRHLVIALFYDGPKVADSWGAVLFDDGAVCDCCLGECSFCATDPKEEK